MPDSVDGQHHIAHPTCFRMLRNNQNEAFGRALDAIAADNKTNEDHFSLVFEDDVARSPAIRQSHVRRMLSCAAWLSTTERPRLPFFYGGVCMPEVTRRTITQVCASLRLLSTTDAREPCVGAAPDHYGNVRLSLACAVCR